MPQQTTPLYHVYEGFALDVLVYRAVGSCPPVREDFLSREALGRRYDQLDYFRAIGVSFLRSFARAAKVGRRLGIGDAIATCDLRRAGIVWAQTGAPDHVTVWASPELLLESVVQCGRDEP